MVPILGLRPKENRQGDHVPLQGGKHTEWVFEDSLVVPEGHVPKWLAAARKLNECILENLSKYASLPSISLVYFALNG